MNLKDGIQLPGEEADKCCWVVPIKPGVIVIGVLIIVVALQSVVNAQHFYVANNLWGILFYCTLIPQVIAAVLFVIFFTKMEDSTARQHTATACMLMIVACIALAVLFLLYPIVYRYAYFSDYLGQIIGDLLVACLWLYFAGVCKRFAG